jgi:hypothetical protein
LVLWIYFICGSLLLLGLIAWLLGLIRPSQAPPGGPVFQGVGAVSILLQALGAGALILYRKQAAILLTAALAVGLLCWVGVAVDSSFTLNLGRIADAMIGGFIATGVLAYAWALRAANVLK